MDVIVENVKLLIFESHPEYLGTEKVRDQLRLLITYGFEMIFHEGDFHVLIKNHFRDQIQFIFDKVSKPPPLNKCRLA